MDRFLIPEMVRFTAGSGSVGQTQRKAILLMSRFLMKVRTRCATLLLSHILPSQRVSSISSELSGDPITNLFIKFVDEVVQIGRQTSKFYEYEYDINLHMIEADDLALLTRVVEAGRRRQRLLDFSQRFRSQISERMRKMMEANAANVQSDCNLVGSQSHVDEKVGAGAVDSTMTMGFLSFFDQAGPHPFMHPLTQSPSHSSHSSEESPLRKEKPFEAMRCEDDTFTDTTEDLFSSSPPETLQNSHMGSHCLPLSDPDSPHPSQDALRVELIYQKDMEANDDEGKRGVTKTTAENYLTKERRREYIEREVTFLIDNFYENLKASLL